MRNWLSAAAALLLAACSRGPGPVHVGSVRIADGALSAALREAGVDEAALDAAAREALGGAGFRLSDGPRLHRARLDVLDVRLAPAGAAGGGAGAVVTVELELAPEDPDSTGGTRREPGSAAVPLSGQPSPRAAWLAALAQAARRAADGLTLGFAEEAKTVDDVVADLSAEDGRVREHAVRVLADRRVREAVPALMRRLREEPRLAQRIVAALAQIGDERAVPAIIELSRTADAPAASRLVRLIGDIGGPEAEGYLLTLESGHPDGRIRKAAREALAELRARQEEALAARK